MIYCLATNPDQFLLLQQDSRHIRPAFEEVLRLTSPVHSFCRTAGDNTEVSGIRIEKNTKILCVLGSANVDERQWPDPTRFDVTRKPIGHLALGSGIHMCVGQNVARAEAQALLNALVQRVSAIELTAEPTWKPNNAMRSMSSLPVRLIPK
jgi:cytochrome P450